ncbi:MAG TPA: T9SS type A sorting domain-containing protein [Chitinophagales bacterium]|nr:T9SS type A sorting domain-containing protein [Chitinophagales bacterium]
MKKNLFLLAGILLLATASFANDTLTRKQVYNFNVGDTFDYKGSFNDDDFGISGFGFSRYVLQQKIYGGNLDTLFLGYEDINGVVAKWDTVTDLDSTAISSIGSPCSQSYSFDTTTYTGRQSNTVNVNCFESGEGYRFTEGLGLTMNSTSRIAQDGTGWTHHNTELIYYASDSLRTGTPYYMLNGSSLMHYTPIPEECAVWTRRMYGSPNPGVEPFGWVTEQISTGSKVYKNGKTYVELYCKIENSITNHFTSDSLIGYFYNDSINKCAVFVSDTNSGTSYQFANFNLYNGSPCGYNGWIVIDVINVAGIARTRWRCTGNGLGMLEGIGNSCGIVPVTRLIDQVSGPQQYGVVQGSLTCFSVCGQTLYPSSSSVCPQLTAVNEVTDKAHVFQIAPNPTSNYVIIAIDDSFIGSTLTITDLTGRRVAEAKLTSSNIKLSTEALPEGLYLATVSIGSQRATQKLIIQK